MWSAIGAIGGALVGGLMQSRSAKKDRQQQMRGAQESIRWKVADARAANINPLFALGAPAYQFQPSYHQQPDYAKLGQNVGEMMDKHLDPFRRHARDLTIAKAREELKKSKLENIGLMQDIRDRQKDNKVDVTGTGIVTPFNPATGKDLQGQAAYVVPEKNTQQSWGVESGWSPASQIVTDYDGNVMFPSTQQMAEVYESSFYDNFKRQFRKFGRHIENMGVIPKENLIILENQKNSVLRNLPHDIDIRYFQNAGNFKAIMLKKGEKRKLLAQEGDNLRIIRIGPNGKIIR